MAIIMKPISRECAILRSGRYGLSNPAVLLSLYMDVLLLDSEFRYRYYVRPSLKKSGIEEFFLILWVAFADEAKISRAERSRAG